MEVPEYNEFQLHYGVFSNGKLVSLVNPSLVYRLDKENELEDIKDAHEFRLAINELIEETDDIWLLHSLAEDLTEIEFYLQELWGFEKDKRYHRFWETQKCTCPKLDNIDMYPHRHIVNLECPLHGELNGEKSSKTTQRSGSLESSSKKTKSGNKKIKSKN